MGRHPIRVVALRTGLSTSVLRAWERRYNVVSPERSDGGQRLYSDADIERLALLNRATQAGRSISQAAQLSKEELERVVAEDVAAAQAERDSTGSRNGVSRMARIVDHELVEEGMAAVKDLDGPRLEALLRRAAVGAGAFNVAERLFAPLLQRIGDAWEEGVIQPRHEHLATEVLRKVLTWMTDSVDASEDAPRIMFGTPAGEQHEIGAMLAASAAVTEGWDVIYLGPSLPVEDIVSSARELGVRAVGLSFVNPEEAGRSGRYAIQIRQQLPEEVVLILGGSAASGLGVVIDRPDVHRVRDLVEFRTVLRDLAGVVAAR